MGNTIKYLFGLRATKETNGEGYEPSPVSKMLAVDSKTDYTSIDFGKKYTGSKKVLVVCTEIRYMVMENGLKFSTGNHPVETAQPLMHLVNAGFSFDIATPTGKPACIKMWALPKKDEKVMAFFKSMRPKLDKPLSLAAIVADAKKMDDYVAVFAPGGQGAMLGLPDDENFGKLIQYIKKKDRYLLSVCHGPASFLAAKSKPHPYAGYKIACFPDAIDKQTPAFGYMPGKQTWYYGEKLIELCDITIVNTGADSTFVADRKLLTGASPKACQELGKVSAEKLLAEYA